jgi:hypothetical protein
MEYRYLGATGLKVSELCLGAMMFGTRTDEQASMEILHKFTDAGGAGGSPLAAAASRRHRAHYRRADAQLSR